MQEAHIEISVFTLAPTESTELTEPAERPAACPALPAQFTG